MNASRTHLRLASILTALVVVAGCHQGDAPTEPPALRATPTPPPAVLLEGTWTGRLSRFGGAPETFTASVTQSGLSVRAAGTLAIYGATRFTGRLDGTRLQGRLSAEHGSSSGCWINDAELAGDAAANSVVLSGYGLCRFDFVRITLTLTR